MKDSSPPPPPPNPNDPIDDETLHHHRLALVDNNLDIALRVLHGVLDDPLFERPLLDAHHLLAGCMVAIKQAMDFSNMPTTVLREQLARRYYAAKDAQAQEQLDRDADEVMAKGEGMLRHCAEERHKRRVAVTVSVAEHLANHVDEDELLS